MKKTLIFSIITLLFVAAIPYEADALRQVAGKPDFNLKPGESATFEWGLASDDATKAITVELTAEGDGAEFLSFEKTLNIDPLALQYTTVTVNIPDDYPGDITLTPMLLATEFGKQGGTTVINIQMLKIITLNIAPNDDPDLRVNWEELKTDEESISEPEPIQEQQVIEEKQEKQMMIVQSEEPIMDAEPVMDPEPVEEMTFENKSEGGGCLIATATYGTELAPQVQMLRELRDKTILNTDSGNAFMSSFNTLYYSFSPAIADLERENPAFRELVKITITPMISTLSLLSMVDIDSEEEMLGYGIGIIMLNGLMYVGTPIVSVIVIRKKIVS